MKKGNSKDTAPKRPGRPKKKVIGGEKVLKEYRNKRAYLTRLKRTKAPTVAVPSAPTVISAGAVKMLDAAIQTAAREIMYRKFKEQLIDLSTKVDVKFPKKRVAKGEPAPQPGQFWDPDNITWASVGRLDRLVTKYQKRWEYKQQYADIRAKIEALPWDVRLPKIPNIITERSVNRLEKIYEKYKDNAPKYRDKVTVTPEDVEEANRKAEEEDLDTEDETKEQDDYDSRYDHDRPQSQDNKPQSIEDEVLSVYRGFINQALDYTTAAYCWSEAHAKRNMSHGGLDYSTWADKVVDHGQRCLDLLADIEAGGEAKKKTAVINLMEDTLDIYTNTEEYLFVYTSYYGRDGDDGAAILQKIEEALLRSTYSVITQSDMNDWSEIKGQYGSVIDM